MQPLLLLDILTVTGFHQEKTPGNTRKPTASHYWRVFCEITVPSNRFQPRLNDKFGRNKPIWKHKCFLTCCVSPTIYVANILTRFQLQKHGCLEKLNVCKLTVLEKESADLKVLTHSHLNSDVKTAFDCGWEKEIESFFQSVEVRDSQDGGRQSTPGRDCHQAGIFQKFKYKLKYKYKFR